jgi:hypothetical protein
LNCTMQFLKPGFTPIHPYINPTPTKISYVVNQQFSTRFFYNQLEPTWNLLFYLNFLYYFLNFKLLSIIICFHFVCASMGHTNFFIRDKSKHHFFNCKQILTSRCSPWDWS